MNRFYLRQNITGDSITISDADQLHHIKDVLRSKAGDEVAVFDGSGVEYLCSIEKLSLREAVLAIKSKRPAGSPPVKITVACAIPKKTSMDDIIDSLTQLGVDRIIPMETERVIVKLDEAKKSARLERWRKIAQSAAEQSHRSTLPQVDPVSPFESVISGCRDFDVKLIPTLPASRPIREIVAAAKPQSIIVLIGPEGDFTPQEVESALKAGFVPVSLGGTVLRVGTAAVAVGSYLTLALT
ncbi:MAG: RsmE family RNA methyltransferase [Dehalococcoidales bacterium]|nr:RsmE family RNA methyltransferase [Dehalococcoidales bacterium]